MIDEFRQLADAPSCKVGTQKVLRKVAAYYERNLNPWDVAAGVLFVTEAGGVVTTIDADGDPKQGKQVLAEFRGLAGLKLPGEDGGVVPSTPRGDDVP